MASGSWSWINSNWTTHCMKVRLANWSMFCVSIEHKTDVLIVSSLNLSDRRESPHLDKTKESAYNSTPPASVAGGGCAIP